jgi:site-specific DNA-cytosine methylase
MIGWDLFSGIGGIKCGMELAGIDPVLGVECDPGDRTLSESFREIHLMNGWTGTRTQTVQDFVEWGCPGLPDRAEIAHISPVCADYSVAKGGGSTIDNMGIAIASMDVLAKGMPRNFTLEQVSGYKDSPEFAYIKARAIALGYQLDWKVQNIGQSFGQSRKRLIMCASLGRSWKVPPALPEACWWLGIQDLISGLKELAPTDRQLTAALGWHVKDPFRRMCPLYVERVTSGKNPKARGSHESIPTLCKSKFRDGSRNGRSQVSSIYLSKKELWLNCDLRVYARLCGFPDGDCNVVGSGFGYAVPPLWYASLLRSRPH